MTQSQLESAIARVTGENVETIQRLGFSPVREPRRINLQPYRHPHRDRSASPTASRDRTHERK